MQNFYNNNIIMATQFIYNLPQIENIIFEGFDYTVPEETMKIILNLTQQVGSPSYDKTPVFKKRDHVFGSVSGSGSASGSASGHEAQAPRVRKNKNVEMNAAEWKEMCKFQTTQLEEKQGIDKELDSIRSFINKITDKNYTDIRNKIIQVIDNVIAANADVDLSFIGSNLFNIASSNRFYSKNYAELYADLLRKYKFLESYYQEKLEEFIKSFDHIEFVDPEENYDKFCEINKANEKRKALSMFYINLMHKAVVSKNAMANVIRDLIAKVVDLISMENKKIQVEEITENIAIMYKPELFEMRSICEDIYGLSVPETIEKIAKSNVSDYKSLTNKTIFKFMDLID